MDFIYLCYPFPTVNHRELTTPEVYPATQEYTKKGAIPFVDHFQIRCFDPETVDRIWPWQELPFSKWNRNQTVRWCWIRWSFSFFEDSHRKHPIRRGSILTPLIFFNCINDFVTTRRVWCFFFRAPLNGGFNHHPPRFWANYWTRFSQPKLQL